MQQHPVPQQISTYEFKLVGDMTLKQFMQLSAGVGIAFLFFVSPLPDFIRWPMIVFFALMGAAFAFLPIQGRPLSTWLIAFFKAVYSPTLYLWKDGTAESVFAQGDQEPQIITPQGKEAAEEYLSSIPQPKAIREFEEKEKSFFQNILKAFQAVAGVSQKPQPQVQPPPPPILPTTPTSPTPAERPAKQPRVAYLVVEEGGKPVLKAIPPGKVPDIRSVKVEVKETPQPQVTPLPKPTYQPQRVAPVLRPTTQSRAARQATFVPEAGPPNPPSQPNVVVGQVLDANGRVVAGAILEIREVGGLPVRALRTNMVGHFLTATPLKNNIYEIITEKEGLVFDPVRFKAEGKVIAPIEIKARANNMGVTT